MKNKQIVLILVMLIFFFQGCVRKEEVEIPVPIFSATLTHSKSNDCACQGSEAWYVANPDPEYLRYAEVRTVTTDTSTNISVTDDKVWFIDKEGAQQPLGCDIWPKDSTPACKAKSTYKIIREGRLIKSFSEETKGFGPFFVPEIATCEAACSNINDPSCLILGSSAKGFVLPLKSLADAAYNTKESVITRDEILKQYGVDATLDTCNRGNINLKDNKIENSGNPCKITTKNSSIAAAGLPISNLWLKKDLRAEKATASFFKTTGTNKHIRFLDESESPVIEFEGPSSEALNRDFGGTVYTVSSYDDYVVYATSNGCIRIDTK